MSNWPKIRRIAPGPSGAFPDLDRRRVLELAGASAAFALAAPSVARAQAYPSRPVRAIVTFAPGGTVVWVLRNGTHSVTADDGSFNRPPGDDWPPFVHTFAGTAAAQAATVTYHCTVHGIGMSGTVTITGGPPRHTLHLPGLRRAR